jgi:hypothetical protein
MSHANATHSKAITWDTQCAIKINRSAVCFLKTLIATKSQLLYHFQCRNVTLFCIRTMMQDLRKGATDKVREAQASGNQHVRTAYGRQQTADQISDSRQQTVDKTTDRDDVHTHTHVLVHNVHTRAYIHNALTHARARAKCTHAHV